jgi:NAD-dependent deacetylase
VTQNIDGLHTRAGSRRVFEIHGNIDTMRCTDGCTSLYPLPYAFDGWEASRPWDDAARAAMVCPGCGAPARPHVLWFDEFYDEEHFKWDSTLAAVAKADLLVVVGTAGATNLPNRMAQLALARRVPIIDVNPTVNPFAAVAERSGGAALVGTACEVLPGLVVQLTAASGGPGDRVE